MNRRSTTGCATTLAGAVLPSVVERRNAAQTCRRVRGTTLTRTKETLGARGKQQTGQRMNRTTLMETGNGSDLRGGHRVFLGRFYYPSPSRNTKMTAVVDRPGPPLGKAKGSFLGIGGSPPRKMVGESFPCRRVHPIVQPLSL